MITAEFLLTSLIVVLIPGTGVLFTVSVGISQGRRASLWAAVGCTFGIVPHLLAAVLGLAALMHASAQAFQFLKFAGVAYLLYLAIITWRDRDAFVVDRAPTRQRSATILRAILLNLLNPKLSIFFLAFLPQFIDASTANPLIAMLLLSAVFMLMTLMVFIAYGLLAHLFRQAVIDSPRIQNALRRGFAAAFAGLAAHLALSER